MMQPYVHDPLLVDWDEPHGELGPGGFAVHWDYRREEPPPLREVAADGPRYTLASLGRAWHHDPALFRWSQVPIPFDYALFGYDKDMPFRRPHLASPHRRARRRAWRRAITRSGFDDRDWSRVADAGRGSRRAASIHPQAVLVSRDDHGPGRLPAAHPGPLYLAVATLTQARRPEQPRNMSGSTAWTSAA